MDTKGKCWHIINIILIFISVILLLCMMTVPTKVDNILLMEKRHTKYWTLFGNRSGNCIKYLPGFDDVNDYISEKDSNLLDNYTWTSGVISGIMIMPNNGKITLSGTATEDSWPRLTNEMLYLDDGTYYISVGYQYPNSSLYIEGWNQNGSNGVIGGIGEGVFTIKEDDYPGGIDIVLPVKGGMTFADVELVPVLYKISNEVVDSDQEAMVFHMKKEEWNSLSNGEKKLVYNRLRYHYSDYPWVSIIFDDGTGIQYEAGDFKIGDINCFGKIRDNQY